MTTHTEPRARRARGASDADKFLVGRRREHSLSRRPRRFAADRHAAWAVGKRALLRRADRRGAEPDVSGHRARSARPREDRQAGDRLLDGRPRRATSRPARRAGPGARGPRRPFVRRICRASIIAAKFPERVEKLIVIDAAITLNPRVGELLKPRLDRLTRVSPSIDAYLAEARRRRTSPASGTSTSSSISAPRFRRMPTEPRSRRRAPSAIGQAMQGLRREPWLDLVRTVRQQTLLSQRDRRVWAAGNASARRAGIRARNRPTRSRTCATSLCREIT